MKRALSFVIAAVIMLSACSGCKSGDSDRAVYLPPSPEPGEYDFSVLDAFLEDALPRIDGGCCLILIKDDEVVYRKAFGTFTLDRVVPIASASKWISGGE